MISLFWIPSSAEDMSQIRYFEVLNNLRKMFIIWVVAGFVALLHVIVNFLKKYEFIAAGTVLAKIHFYQFCDKFCIRYNISPCFIIFLNVIWCIRSICIEARLLLL